MSRSARLQLIGPAALVLALLAAEGAAFALAVAPSSALLWYLNLEVFSLFRMSRATLGEFAALPFAQVFLLAGPVVLIGLVGLVLRRNLCLAISSNLSFVAAAFVAYSSVAWMNAGQAKTASLVPVHIPAGSALYLILALFLASFVSFAASHHVYLRALRTGT